MVPKTATGVRSTSEQIAKCHITSCFLSEEIQKQGAGVIFGYTFHQDIKEPGLNLTCYPK